MGFFPNKKGGGLFARFFGHNFNPLHDFLVHFFINTSSDDLPNDGTCCPYHVVRNGNTVNFYLWDYANDQWLNLGAPGGGGGGGSITAFTFTPGTDTLEIQSTGGNFSAVIDQDTNDILTAQAFTIGGTTYPINTNLTTIINALRADNASHWGTYADLATLNAAVTVPEFGDTAQLEDGTGVVGAPATRSNVRYNGAAWEYIEPITSPSSLAVPFTDAANDRHAHSKQTGTAPTVGFGANEWTVDIPAGTDISKLALKGGIADLDGSNQLYVTFQGDGLLGNDDGEDSLLLPIIQKLDVSGQFFGPPADGNPYVFDIDPAPSFKVVGVGTGGTPLLRLRFDGMNEFNKYALSFANI